MIPSRKPYKGRLIHMISNIGLVGINNILLGFLPIVPIIVSEYALEHNVGLFQLIPIPFWITIVLQILMMDMIIYFQHRIFQFL